ncbi:MAG: hypothetical protein IPL61_21950 [Myxococcales bacterium]|nr:hypothetical protein [Myxococcales bacterium]
MFSLAGASAAVFSGLALRGLARAPEPQGSAAAIGLALAPAVAWTFLVLSAIVAVVATIAFTAALLEARAAKRLHAAAATALRAATARPRNDSAI